MIKPILALLVVSSLSACDESKKPVVVDTKEYKATSVSTPSFRECIDSLKAMEDAGYKLRGEHIIKSLKETQHGWAYRHWHYQNKTKVVVFYCDAMTKVNNSIQVWSIDDYNKSVNQQQAAREAKRLAEIEANKKLVSSKGF